VILTYNAVDKAGQRRADSIEASTKHEAVEQLRRQGLFVTEISEGSSRTPSARTSAKTHARGLRLPQKALVQITRQIAMLLRAGSELVPGLAAIKRQLRNPRYIELIRRLIMDLEEGAPLSEALQKHPRAFDPVYCAIVAAGEASGTLAEMFERLGQVVSRRRALRRKILGALTYPALLICMCFHITLVILLFVLPRFNVMFTELNVPTPSSTKFLLSISGVIQEHGIILAVGVIALAATAVGALVSAAGRQWLADIQIYVPIIGRLRSRLIQGQVFRTLGTLLESGVGLLESIELAARSTTNSRYRKLFTDLMQSVTSGGGLATAFDNSGLVDPAICQAIRTGEECGSLGGSLTFCADTFDETNEEFITTITRLMEPVILIGMGLVVGTVAVSLFMPLFDMTSAIR